MTKIGAPLHESHFPACWLARALVDYKSIAHTLTLTHAIYARSRRVADESARVPTFRSSRISRASPSSAVWRLDVWLRGVTFSFGSTIERRARSRRSVRILRPTEWVARVGEHPHAVPRSVRHHPGPHLSPRRVSGFRLVSTRCRRRSNFPPLWSLVLRGRRHADGTIRHDSNRHDVRIASHRVDSYPPLVRRSSHSAPPLRGSGHERRASSPKRGVRRASTARRSRRRPPRTASSPPRRVLARR